MRLPAAVNGDPPSGVKSSLLLGRVLCMDLSSPRVDIGFVGSHSTVVELGVEDSSTAGTYSQPSHFAN